MTKQPINGHGPDGKDVPMSEERQSTRDRARTQPYEPDYPESDRKPSAERPNAFNALAWLVEGATGLWEELHHNDLGLTEEFWKHAYAARRESLLALRAAVDALIAQTESQARQEEERQQRRERRGGINIDF
jgi:hypothetical protein